MKAPRMILLAGLGNIGSIIAPLLARMCLADFLVLVDPDVVEARNMAAQAYGPADVGLTKVDAMARQLAGLNAALRIECFVGALEDLPLGYFAATVVLCLDHHAPRQVAAERAWQMGGALYDVAVNGQAGLARVSRFVPDFGRACLECAWSDAEYHHLRVRHACGKVPPTHAPAALGAFAASLAAMQILAPAPGDSNSEIVSCPGAAEMWISKLQANAGCRFHHQAPSVERWSPFDFTMPFASLFSLLDTSSIALPGFSFVGRGRCARCGIDDEILLLNRCAGRVCPHCATPMEFLPFHARDRIRPEDFAPHVMAQDLRAVGLRPGDVVQTENLRRIQLGVLLTSNESPTPAYHD